MSYDSKCEELAEHFLRDADRLDCKAELAQVIQEEIEFYISYCMPLPTARKPQP
jgi:hypothetical protein